MFFSSAVRRSILPSSSAVRRSILFSPNTARHSILKPLGNERFVERQMVCLTFLNICSNLIHWNLQHTKDTNDEDALREAVMKYEIFKERAPTMAGFFLIGLGVGLLVSLSFYKT